MAKKKSAKRKRPAVQDAQQEKAHKRQVILKFMISYVLLMGLLLLLIGLKPVKDVLDIDGLYTQMILALTTMALEPFGIVQSVSGSVIALSGISLEVRFGCNGLEAFMIYTVGILAFPSPGMWKVWGVGGGFVILQVLNVLRITGLALSGVYLPQYFEIMHIYVAQGIMIAFALVLFLVWMHYAPKT
ncbi:MAG: archaeosortase/exosortase family protein [Desulfovermiculus sp.]|nr:archaeosortase/exosortase family protein [Desulfovermiculus sp.]